MSVELLGLRNMGEFYSQHYLASLLENDVRDTLASWNQAENDNGKKPPQRRLSALANEYFKAQGLATGQADPVVRLELAQGLHASLLEALGYERRPAAVALEDGTLVPVVAQEDFQGRPYLWVLETSFRDHATSASPFEDVPLAAQLPDDARDATLVEGTYRELFDRVIFRQTDAPRWVLFLAGSDLFLIDRKKWARGQYLQFELSPLMSRRQPKVFDALCGLLHREVLLPHGGTSILDKLDENSHKHAYAVSTDLKRGAQRAIELLANEVIFYRSTVSKKGVYQDEELARALTAECITYLYRLLFLFYVESRGQALGVVPMAADSYRLGYSLEGLRDFELTPLSTNEARNGTYLHDSLEQLFRIMQDGYPTSRQLTLDGGVDGFEVAGLRSQLFDPERTPILRGVKLRNFVLQEIIALLSLSDPKKRKARGRISYTELGINQLGAVYEGLLSYRGFFATEKCIEVHAKGSDPEQGDQTYFVPLSRKGEFDDDQVVREPNGKPVLYEKGEFVFRMAGRDREKSASYYTDEKLTYCLTKYTLKERLKDLTADEILELTVCEPAMGSGAFLNEAVNQLAEAYLQRKQQELGEEIPSERYQKELQKVKYHLAVHNCYGVDLNPLAATLGKVSLWLNVLHEGASSPFFDLRIMTGNSLIGARREVFLVADLTRKSGKDSGDNWLSMTPERLPWGTKRPSDGVYHFLVPDAGMAPFEDDKVLKNLEPEGTAALKKWRSAITQPFSAAETKRLEKLSARVDELWQAHLKQRSDILAKLRSDVGVWRGERAERSAEREVAKGTRDALTLETLAKPLVELDAPGQVLKLVMDYWCALWFWPLAEASSLPTRAQWLDDVEAVLEGRDGRANEARISQVQRLADAKRFFHWELAFVEVFAERGGMDVILGNPPWRKVEWNEGAVLGDFDAALAVKKLSAKQWADARAALLSQQVACDVFAEEAEDATATGAYLNAGQNYPLLKGVQTNLYKCFITRTAALGAPLLMAGILHQKGLYDDPNGGLLRKELAHRLRWHMHFLNKLKLFSEITDKQHYEMSIFGDAQRSAAFLNVSNLIHPDSIHWSEMHDGIGEVPRIQTDDEGWDLRGHKSRLVPIDEDTLALFAKLYDAPNTPALEARLPIVHSREVLDVLHRFALAPKRLGDLEGQYFSTVCFDETNAQKDGIIKRATRAPKNVSEWIVSGPHFYVGNPLNKTPNPGCKHNQDYSSLDLTQIPDDYLPLTNYVPACSAAEYRERTPKWNVRAVTEFYRYVNRRMVAPTGERTLIPAVIPPGAAHVDLVFSIAFSDNRLLALVAGLNSSLPIDFFVKSTGKGDARADLLKLLPIVADGPMRAAVIVRALRLNCLTVHYAALWKELYDPTFEQDGSTSSHGTAPKYSELSATWRRDIALRTPFERRQALVELDALAALALGMRLEELKLIYRVQFPVLQEYERETYYDQRGKIVFTVNRGMSDVGLERKQWEEIKDAKKGDKLPTWAHDQQGPFVPPFDRCDRETDMAQAYEAFAQRFGLTVARRQHSVPAAAKGRSDSARPSSPPPSRSGPGPRKAPSSPVVKRPKSA